jgi:hypothetical protein
MTRSANMRQARCGISIVLLMLMSLVARPDVASAQYGDAQIQHSRGQNVAPTFEGWFRNPDGSFDFVFGYMNRNYQEVLNIPIGPDNNIQPGGPDRGQPTHFYPRRAKALFKVRIPKGWDPQQRVVWSLTAHGRTDVAKGWLQPEWEIEDGLRTRQGEPNTPPAITGSADQQITWPARTVSLTVSVKDDGKPKPSRRRRTLVAPANPSIGVVGNTEPDAEEDTTVLTGGGLTARWIQYRGPDNVTFEPASAPKVYGKPVTLTTSATFSVPGSYLLWAIADDGLISTVHAVTVTVNPSK